MRKTASLSGWIKSERGGGRGGGEEEEQDRKKCAIQERKGADEDRGEGRGREISYDETRQA